MVYTTSKKHRPEISGGSFVFFARYDARLSPFIYMPARDCIASPNPVGSASYNSYSLQQSGQGVF